MSKLVVTEIESLATGSKASTDHIAAGSLKSRVNFNGTGTPSIRASLNISSLTDHATGTFTLNFSNAFTDTNYTGLSGWGGDGFWGYVARTSGNNSSYHGKTTSTHRFDTPGSQSGTLYDVFDTNAGMVGIIA